MDPTHIIAKNQRIVSGMRPTGRMHLGHYHGALKNWLQLQYEQECWFFAGDLHALTTHYADPKLIAQQTFEMVADWLAAGIDPKHCKVFIQSAVPEHAELSTLLGMMIPLSWLERVPTYKEQQEKLHDKDLATYGFLGYPALMAADILLYKTNMVPVGEDQMVHVELTREIARRFNHLYGKDADFLEKALKAIEKMGQKKVTLFNNLCKEYQEQGHVEAIATGRALIDSQHNLSLGDKERLQGYLEGTGKIILVEPEALLTQTPKVSGLDGQKMSKSYNNSIFLTEEPEQVQQKVKTMVTDPARIRRNDPGDPEKCPVWSLHQLYSDDTVKDWVQQGCRNAGIGCIECKATLSDGIIKQHAPILKRSKELQQDPNYIRAVLKEGQEAAQDTAKETIREVKKSMGIDHE